MCSDYPNDQSEIPGSARWQRAGDRVYAIANLASVLFSRAPAAIEQDRFGRMPKPARCKRALPGIVGALLVSGSSLFGQDNPQMVLRVAADPNNLPFSNERCEGFENKIAELIATDLGAKLEYAWRAQRRGFFRETLKENRADLVLGVPEHFDMALTTAPYYTSTYVFVSRRDRHINITTLNDPALRGLKIGVQIIGNDARNTPPVHALADRGIVNNILGFTVYGDYTRANPPARIIDAVVNDEIDVAIVWGPLAGYFAKKQSVPLDVTPVTPAADPALPFTYSIAMGVRKNDRTLRDQLNALLVRRRGDIEKILDEYGVPRVEPHHVVSVE